MKTNSQFEADEISLVCQQEAHARATDDMKRSGHAGDSARVYYARQNDRHLNRLKNAGSGVLARRVPRFA